MVRLVGFLFCFLATCQVSMAGLVQVTSVESVGAVGGFAGNDSWYETQFGENLVNVSKSNPAQSGTATSRLNLTFDPISYGFAVDATAAATSSKGLTNSWASNFSTTEFQVNSDAIGTLDFAITSSSSYAFPHALMQVYEDGQALLTQDGQSALFQVGKSYSLVTFAFATSPNATGLSGSLSFSAVPEPSSILLVGCAGTVALLKRRRRTER